MTFRDYLNLHENPQNAQNLQLITFFLPPALCSRLSPFFGDLSDLFPWELFLVVLKHRSRATRFWGFPPPLAATRR